MSTKIEIVQLPPRSATTQSEISVTLPAGSGWQAVGAVPFADAHGPAAAVVFDNGEPGAVVFAQGITAEDTSPSTASEGYFTNLVQIPADTLAVGDRIKVVADFKVLDNNAGDTLALALKLAAAAGLATSTLDLANVAAVDPADNDSYHAESTVRVVAIGAAATAKFVGSGFAYKNGGTPAFLGTYVDDDTSVATNAIIDVGASYLWSGAHADNDVRIKNLFVTVFRPQA